MRYQPVRSAIGVVVAALVLSGATTQGQGRGRGVVERVEGRDVVAGEVLVKFRTRPGAAEVQQLGRDHDLDGFEPIGRARMARMRSRSQNAAALLRRLADNPNVEYAEPNYILHAIAQPNDPQLPQLWGLLNTGQTIKGVAGTPGADIHAAEAWNLTSDRATTSSASSTPASTTTIPISRRTSGRRRQPFTVTIGGDDDHVRRRTHGFNAITRTLRSDGRQQPRHARRRDDRRRRQQRRPASSASTGRRSIMGSKFLDANGSGTTADAINAHRIRDSGKQAFRRPAPPTSACCRTAGAAAGSRRRCSTKSSRQRRRHAVRCRRRQQRPQQRLRAVLSGQLHRAERHRRRGDGQPRSARLVLELRRFLGPSRRARRRHPVDDASTTPTPRSAARRWRRRTSRERRRSCCRDARFRPST